MKFKLTAVIANSDVTTRELTVSELESLTDGNNASGQIVISGTDEIDIICDLYNRYNVDRLDYFYFGSGGTIDISVASSYQNWSGVSHSTITSGVSSDIHLYNPRWVRIKHSANSNNISINEVELYSRDENILFGHSGEFGVYSVDYNGQVQAISLFNPTSTFKDIKVFVEDDYTVSSDEAVAVGVTSAGPFFSKREMGVNIPNDFPWANGDLTNLTISGNSLCLSSPNSSGTYYSPVFYTGNYSNLRFFWEQTVPEGGLIDYVSSHDSERSFGVRRYSTSPSGFWVNGSLADGTDSLWSIVSGTLPFESISNNTILELRDRDYIQFNVTITGSYLNSPCIQRAGVESALVVSGVPPNSYKDFYISVSSGTSTQTANLMCWYEE